MAIPTRKANTYENGSQKIIPAVLLFAHRFSENRFTDSGFPESEPREPELLMIHRNSNQNDHHLNKWNGLGGKLEIGETFLSAAVREFQEESGAATENSQWKWLGQLFFPNFKAHLHQDWLVNIFSTHLNSNQISQIKTESQEGSLHWIPFSQVLSLNLWDGDRHFLPLILQQDLQQKQAVPFQGTLFYENGHCVHHEIFKLSSQ